MTACFPLELVEFLKRSGVIADYSQVALLLYSVRDDHWVSVPGPDGLGGHRQSGRSRAGGEQVDCPPGLAFNGLPFRTFRLALWFSALLSAGAVLGRMLG